MAVSQLASEFSRESMLSPQKFFGVRQARVVSTGSLKLDLALGIGGLPKVTIGLVHLTLIWLFGVRNCVAQRFRICILCSQCAG